jgi:hypothetical protein
MKFPRFSVRELVMLVAITGLALACAIEHWRVQRRDVTVKGLLALVDEGDRKSHWSEANWQEAEEKLRDCQNSLRDAKATLELKARPERESAGPR